MSVVDWMMVVFSAVITVGCGYLVLAEWTRMRRDRTPLPPLDPEVAATDRWHNAVTLAIAALSIIGAVMAWDASNQFDSASDLSREAVNESVRYQSVRALSDGRIDFDARLTLLYQEHLRAEASYYEKATAARNTSDTVHAGQLEAEARVEGAVARLFSASFLTSFPTINADNSVTYDRQAQLALARADDSDLRTLDPASVRTISVESSQTRRVAQQLVVAGAMFIAAMFFLTVADLGWLHRRLLGAFPAFLAAFAGLGILFVAKF